MVRTNGKSRGKINQKGAQKQRNIQKIGKSDIFQQLENLIPPKYRKTLHLYAERCYNLFSKVCCDFCLVPFGRDLEPGRFTTSQKSWQIVVFYCILAVQFTSMLQKFTVVIQRLSNGIMDLSTTLSLVALIIYFVGYSIAASVLFRPRETVQLLNANPIILERMLKGGKSTNVFDYPKVALIVAITAILGGSIAIMASFYGFIVNQFPCALYQILSAYFGLHPPEFLPGILWKCFFWPLELTMHCQPMLLGAWAGIIMVAYPTIGKSCTDELRQMEVKSEDNWMKLRTMYSSVKMYTILANDWVKFMIIPTLFSASCAIIICLYVTIRHTEITIIIYAGFPYTAFNLLGLLFWISFEALALIRTTEDIVGILNSRTHTFLAWLPIPEKMYIWKAGKAARPIRQDVGSFGAFSINVPFSVWDEILNQLLFLLEF